MGILKERQEQRAKEPPVQRLGLQEIQELANQAMKIIPNKVGYYAEQIQNYVVVHELCHGAEIMRRMLGELSQIMADIKETTGITETVGIGTNLYLAKLIVKEMTDARCLDMADKEEDRQQQGKWV